MVRIPQRSTYLKQTTRSTEWVQLIHDKETNMYLNYWQLLRHPNFTAAWNKLAANEFGRLAQGLKNRHVKGTDTIKFIQKDQVPIKRIKDVMYGIFSCDFKPNNEEKECTRLTAGGDKIKLTRRLRNADSRHDLIQDPHQQHSIHPKCQMHHDRYQRLLLENPNEETGVHVTQDHEHIGRSHWALQVEDVSNTKWICIAK